jgi:hypothetical protein
MYCAQVYPSSAMAQFMPLMQKSNLVPSWYSGTLAQKHAQLASGTVYNIDGKPVKFNPCQGRCSMNHLDSNKPVYWQTGQKYTTLGGVVTAPVFYQQCGGGVAKCGGSQY